MRSLPSACNSSPRNGRHCRKLLWTTAACLLFLQPGFAANLTVFEQVIGFEPHFVPPLNSGMVDVRKDFGAVGDGRHDDTDAFKRALESDEPRAIYVPRGTYLIRDQLRYGARAQKKKRTLLIGEQCSATVLRLADSCAGFGDPTNPRAFLHTRPAGQQAEQNMHQYLYHLTIEIGRGNPGAIALNFHTSNTGCVKDVRIRATDRSSPGLRGLACDDQWFGPGMARYVEVEGFREGVFLGSAHNHTTLEHITVRSCGVGLVNKGNSCSVRRLTTEGCSLAVSNEGKDAHMVLLEGRFTEGKGGPAVLNQGRLLARPVTATGYATAIGSVNGRQAASPVTQFLSHDSLYLTQTGNGARLPVAIAVKESPEFQYPQSAREWAVMPSRGDIADSMQRAIDAGARVICIPHGSAQIGKTVIVRSSVERIMGLGVVSTHARMRIEQGRAKTFCLELLYGVKVTLATRRTVVLRHCGASFENESTGNGCEVFLEGVCAAPLIFRGLNVWARDVNTETGGSDPFANVVNDGGRLWLLGQKTEDYGTKIATVNGAHTELLGGAFRQNWDTEDGVDKLLDTAPLFLVENSTACLSFKTFTNYRTIPAYRYLVFRRDDRGTEKIPLLESGNVPLWVVLPQGGR